MDLLKNPFFILGASPRDNKSRIMELSEERSLLHDSGECEQACTILVNPKKRLAAELAWLPGVSPARVQNLISLLDKSPAQVFDTVRITPIAQTNLLVSALSRLSACKVYELSSWIKRISCAFDEIDYEKTSLIINEERTLAGVPKVTDLSWVEEEIQNLRLYYLKIINLALDNLPTKDLVDTMTITVEALTDVGEKQAPILVDNMVDSYDVNAQQFLEKEEKNIEFLVEGIRDALDSKKPDSEIKSMCDNLIQVVKNWDFVAQPIQVSTKSRGLSHEASHRVGRLVRGLTIYMFNEHGKLELSKMLTHTLQEVFAEVVDIAEMVSEDSNALKEIAEQQILSKKKHEQWKREITYEANIGLIFKNKLKISADGVEWKNRKWPINTITKIRWGGVRNTVNGIPSGTTYTIIVGNDREKAHIETKRRDVYNRFVDCLWRSVGVKLLTDYLIGLSEGKKYNFGSYIMNDFGIEYNNFINGKKYLYHWKDLLIGNGPGFFVISGKNGFTARFYYLNDDNIHVLEAALSIFWKKGGVRLSSILETK